MSLLPSSTNANLTTPFFSPVACGRFNCAVGETQQNIPIQGMTLEGLVMAIYLHVNSGGASQYILAIEPDENSCYVNLNTVAGAGEYIIWHVLKYF